MGSLHDALATAAAAPRLKVVCDFDGTLADFCLDPTAVVAHPPSMGALQQLSHQPGVEVIVLSGRSFDSLHAVCPLTAPVRLVGSHGAEDGAPAQLPAADAAALATLDEQLEKLCAPIPGAWVESKPLHRVLHVRAVTDEAAAHTLLEAARALAGGFTLTEGKKVLEFGLSTATKGEWITTHRGAEDTVVFIGDDTTDETGFAVLQGKDVGIKVGSGDTAATHRVADVAAVGEVLEILKDARVAP